MCSHSSCGTISQSSVCWGLTDQLLFLTANLRLDVLTVFNGNISAAILIHKLLLEPGHLLAYLCRLGDAGALHCPALSVNSFFLADIFQFSPADCLGVGDVLQDRLNAALVGDAVHTQELLHLLALCLPGSDVPAHLPHLRIALLLELGLADDFVDGLSLGLFEDGGHLGPAV